MAAFHDRALLRGEKPKSLIHHLRWTIAVRLTLGPWPQNRHISCSEVAPDLRAGKVRSRRIRTGRREGSPLGMSRMSDLVGVHPQGHGDRFCKAILAVALRSREPLWRSGE
jgi:hypothetical protein